jgi:hypothetical protein
LAPPRTPPASSLWPRLASHRIRRGLRLALAEWGERQTDAPPSPSLAVIEAHAISELIIHLEYKEITHLGYALLPSSAVQSVY